MVAAGGCVVEHIVCYQIVPGAVDKVELVIEAGPPGVVYLADLLQGVMEVVVPQDIEVPRLDRPQGVPGVGDSIAFDQVVV